MSKLNVYLLLGTVLFIAWALGFGLGLSVRKTEVVRCPELECFYSCKQAGMDVERVTNTECVCHWGAKP